MRFAKHKAAFITALFILLVMAVPAFALDPPHTPEKGVACNDCHSHWNDAPGDSIDKNTVWQLCRSCHSVAGGHKVKDTHSGRTTSSETKYLEGGEPTNWLTSCTSCHDPHFQAQTRSFPTDYASGGSYLYLGIINAISANTVTFSPSPGWNNGDWKDYKVYLGDRRKLMYYIQSNTADTLTVERDIRQGSRYAAVGGTGRITYGMFIRDQARSPRPIKSSDGTVYNAGLYRTVKYFNNTGAHSPADSMSNPTALCAVCHTRTKVFNIGYITEGQSFDTIVSDYANQSHKDRTSVTETCWQNSSCHNPPATGFDANCAGCHGSPPTSLTELINSPEATDRTTAGKHAFHSSKGFDDCNYCHTGGGPDDLDHTVGPLDLTLGFTHGLSQGTYTVSNFPNLNFGFEAGDAGTTVNSSNPPSTSPGDCSNIYCHSDGTGAAGVFRSVNWETGGSLGCDDCHGNTTGTDVITGKHALHAYGNYNFACYECHDATVDANKALKADGQHVDATKDIAFGNISSGGDYTTTCNNAYCHSDARSTYKTPAWTEGALGCNGCHATSPTSDAHGKHTALYNCADCHNDTVASGNSPVTGWAKHVNKVKDVVPTGNGADGNDYNSVDKTCATLNCHGSKSPAWDSDFTGIDTCVRCHGDDTAGSPATDAQKAPGGSGTDTNGDSDAKDAEVGAHQAHLNSVSNYTSDVACSDCHEVPGTVTGGNHINTALPAEMAWSTFATNSGNLTPGYNDATGVCSNVYCHGAKMPKGSNNGSDITPIWNDTAYLSGSPGDAGDGSGDCEKCHGSPPNQKHAGDETLSGSKACSKCHTHFNDGGGLNDVTLHIDGIVQGGCESCHGQPPVSTATMVNSNASLGITERSGPGAHGFHVNTKSFNCDTCHTGGGSNGQHNDSPTTEVTMGFVINTVLGGTYDAPLISNANYSVGNDGTTVTTSDGANRTCTNIYCHSDGDDYDGSNTPATADWDASGPLACDSCHGGSGKWVDNNVHPKHVTDYSIACDTCHYDTVNASNTIIGNHVNYNKDVAFKPGSMADSGNYAGRPNCTNIDCHSQGTASYVAPNVTPMWNATLGNLDCKGCHNNNQASGTPMLTGTHTSHINNSTAIGQNFGCVSCHTGTVDDDSTIGTGKIGNHVNGTANVILSSTYGGSYAGGDCSSVYCHSDGNQGNLVYKTVTWGTSTTGCKSCHGNGTVAYPSYADGNQGTVNANSHNKHVGASQVKCEQCHNDTSVDGTAINGASPGVHVNMVNDVSFKQGGGWNGSTCANTYCHGVAATSAWGTTGATNCGSCHGASSGMPGSHAAHFANSTTATEDDLTPANNSDTTRYEFSCGVCHQQTDHTGGVVSGNQAAEVIFNATVAGASATHSPGALGGNDNGFNYTAATCTNTYCHSKGEGTAGNVTPAWGVTTTNCNSCHDSSPITNAHKSHINNGTVMDDKNCNTCHSVTASIANAIASKSTHVSGAPDVDTNATWGGTFASDTCSSVYCHTDGKGNTANILWSTGVNADCVTCHGGAGGTSGGAGTALSATHTIHTGAGAGQFNYGCVNCHAQTVSNNTTINNTTIHTDKTKDVWVNALVGGDGADYASNTCATTNCHGTGSADWIAGGTTGDCSLCHGMAADPADGRDTIGNTLASDPEVGAHVAHLTNASSMSSAIACSDCHLEPAGATYVDKIKVATHMDGPGGGMLAEMTWSTFATNSGNLTPAYDPSTGVCSNTYCHGNKMPKNSNPGIGNKPVWGNNDYLSGTYNTDCSQCHGFPPTENSKHSTMTVGDGSNCNACHPHMYDAVDAAESGWVANGTAFSDQTLHIDGEVQAAGDCDSCHGYPPVKGDEINNYAYTAEGKGVLAHEKHVAHLEAVNSVARDKTVAYGVGVNTIVCGVCHSNNEATDHMSGTRNINFDGDTSFLFNTGSPQYNGTEGQTESGSTFKSCSNVSCHFKETPGWHNPTTPGP